MTVGPVRIDDPGDPRVADYIRLTDASARAEGVFIAEGSVVIRQLLASPYRIRSVLLTPTRWDELRPDLSQHDISVYIAAQDVMNAVTGFEIHRGAVAAADRLPLPLAGDLVARAHRLLVIEAVTDHENMGALFRNAAAFGIDAVLLSPQACDPLYRRSVRVSAGQALLLPFTRVADWPSGLATLSDQGFAVIALTPDPATESIDDVVADATGLDRFAVVVGTEGTGLTAEALAASSRRARIPMAIGVDSLNVATAAAIAMFMLTRR